MKKKTLIAVLLSFVGVLLLSFSIAVVYAYSASLTYNYDVKANSIDLTYTNDLKVSSSNNNITITKFDVIIESNNQNPISGQEYNTKKNNIFVYTGLPAGNSTYSLSANSIIKRVLPRQIKKNDILYDFDNRYVGDENELRKQAFNKFFNAMFIHLSIETNYTNTIYAIDDIVISKNLLINNPVSFDMNGYSLTINEDAKFEIKHPFRGSFYLDVDSITNGTNFYLTCVNANYDYDNTVFENSHIILKNDEFDKENDLLDYLASLVPEKVYSDIMLPTYYEPYDMHIKYEISYNSNAYEDFSMKFSRSEANQNATLKIICNNSSREIPLVIYGTNKASFVNALTNEIITQYQPSNNNLDLYSVIDYVYKQGFIGLSSFNIRLNAKEIEMLTDLRLNGESVNNITITFNNNKMYNGNEEITSLTFNKGFVNIYDTVELNIEGTIIELDILSATLEETLIFLQSKLSTFTTDLEYPLLYIKDNGIYLGTNKISNTKLGLNSIRYDVIDGETGLSVLNEFFIVNKDPSLNAISLSAVSVKNILENVYLAYYQEDEELFRLRIQNASPDSGSEDITFTSNNPFDGIFENTDINWLEGTSFNIIDNSNFASHYAGITIEAINGIPYSDSVISTYSVYGREYNVNLSKIISIVPKTEDMITIEDKSYYKEYTFISSIDYVPIVDTVITFKCVAIDSTTNIASVTQEYDVVVPGIYKCIDEASNKNGASPCVFANREFYSMTIELLQDTYLNKNLYTISLQNSKTYILSYASTRTGELDYTKCSKKPSSAISVKGIEFFSEISKLNLSSYAINDLSSLKYYDSMNLTELDLHNCSLTNSILFDNEGNGYLKGLYLNKLDLSYNSISNLNNLLFRGITNLNISNQTNLSDIEGLSSLHNLVNLDASNNNIYRFEPLKEIITLKNIYLYNNKMGTFYGSTGLINIPVYVWMIKTNGVKIYCLNNSDYLSLSDTELISTINNNKISSEAVEGAVSLNAFALPKVYDTIDEINAIISDINSLNIYTFVETSGSTMVPSNKIKLYRFSEGNKIYDETSIKGDYYFLLAALDESSNIIALREFKVSLAGGIAL